jgi:Ca2+-transporting ATPase
MAVAAVPEGLPAVVTIGLALGAQRMLRRRALIRRLPAAETLGSVTVICSDKTGTLTENRMTVTSLEADGQRHDQAQARIPSSEAFDLLLTSAALCNDTRVVEPDGEGQAFLGDPMEIAFVVAAERAGLKKNALEAVLPRVAEIAFDSQRMRMTTVHRLSPEALSNLPGLCQDLHGEGFVVFTKGAVESVLGRCNREFMGGKFIPLGSAGQTAVQTAAERLASSGQRVLGFACRFLTSLEDSHLFERSLVFLGLAGLSDPTRLEARAAVKTCQAAGIRPLMITGDHRMTAAHVARELGIGGEILTGADLQAMSAAELSDAVEKVSIFARVLPEQKFRIVQALQARGHIVSMTGDGVNDAPALKQADIGVAMGISGTDVSKQASDMVLLDDNFATIVSAVEEGRTIYDNIRKFIRYVLAGNCGEIFVMLLGPLCGLPMPLLPLQILWINLASDGLNGLALSVEPPEFDTMSRPPRPPDESIFARGMIRHILCIGILLGATSLAVGLFHWHHQEATWQTTIFVTLAVGQIFQILAARSWRDSLFWAGFAKNWVALVTVAITLGSTLAIVYVPFLQSLFGARALPPGTLFAVLLLGTSAFWGIELEKWLLRKKR